MILAVSALCVLILLVVNYWISLKITRPLNLFVGNMQEVSRGNLDVKLVVNTNDELKLLADNFNTMLFKVKELITRLVEEEKIKNRVKLEALQSKINSHFLYNSLNMIRYIARDYDADDIREITTSLISLLQVSISNPNELIPIENEITYVMQYITIQRYHFGQKFKLVWDADDSVLAFSVPKLILQPLVENSFFHGFNASSDNCLIRISIKDSGENVLFSIEDNGSGVDIWHIRSILDGSLPENKDRRERHVGIFNVDQRLKIMFGESSRLQYSGKIGEGTTVEFRIPKIKPLE